MERSTKVLIIFLIASVPLMIVGFVGMTTFSSPTPPIPDGPVTMTPSEIIFLIIGLVGVGCLMVGLFGFKWKSLS